MADPSKETTGILPRQCPVALLAGSSSGVGSVSKLSNSVRSLVKPALHVGKQIDGGSGWRACTGSAGMAGGCTTTGGKGCATVAQPLTSISSGNSISAGSRKGLSGFIGGFLHLCGAALFFSAGAGFGLARGVSQFAHLLGMLGAGVGMGCPLTDQLVGLPAGQQQGTRQGDSQGAGDDHIQPRYFGLRTSSTSVTWCRLMSQALRPP